MVKNVAKAQVVVGFTSSELNSKLTKIIGDFSEEGLSVTLGELSVISEEVSASQSQGRTGKILLSVLVYGIEKEER